MKKLVFLVIACFLFSIPNLAICEEFTGNVNFFLGVKQLDEDDWEPLEEHDEYGISLDFKQKTWPVSIAIGYLSSSDEETASVYVSGFGTVAMDYEGETTELSFGIRKIWDDSPSVRPYIGAGIALIEAEIAGTALGVKVSDDDSATGFWFGAGVYLTVSERFNIGFNFRWSKAEVTLFDIEGEAGGTHYGLLLGIHW